MEHTHTKTAVRRRDTLFDAGDIPLYRSPPCRIFIVKTNGCTYGNNRIFEGYKKIGVL
ncbi:hypothetical protein R6Q59_006782, partial [Mikania micrantha]